jgi:exodeoxyribonuclease VII large subunit
VPLESTPESPLPVRTVARAIGEWIGRLGRVWVEGQVTELSGRAATAFLTLRDPVADVSLRITCPRAVCETVQPPLAEGARVVVWAKPDFYLMRGTLSLTAYDIRPVGVGALLARLEQLRQVLAAEGLFAAERKRPLPFLPGTVGLVTGRDSAAERDVVENARRRWPAVRFRIEAVAVQGAYAVSQMLDALARLDTDPAVDVIVLARGGGSVEDLLPFSDEALCRAVAACRTPVVSAVGHETDTPLVDHVADRRASTPTDAGKLVVPDMAEEVGRVEALRQRTWRCLHARLDQEQRSLDALHSRPALAAPVADLDRRAADIGGHVERARRCLAARLDGDHGQLQQLRARVGALSPAATLERGYAVLQKPDGTVVRDPAEVSAGETLTARVAGGRIGVRVTE